MKSKMHAIAGVFGFLCAGTFLTSTVLSMLLGDSQTLADVKGYVLVGLFFLLAASMAAGATGVSLLGTRTEPLASAKQRRGPIAFMTGLFVWLPSAWFISSRASAGLFDAWFYGIRQHPVPKPDQGRDPGLRRRGDHHPLQSPAVLPCSRVWTAAEGCVRLVAHALDHR